MSDNRKLCDKLPMCLHSQYNTYTFLANKEEMKEQVSGILANLETGFESLEFRVKHGVPAIDLKTYFNFFKKEGAGRASSSSSWISLDDYYKVRSELYKDKSSYSFDLPLSKIESQLKSVVQAFNYLYSDNLSSLNYEKFKKLEALRWLLMSSAVMSRWDTENDNNLGIYDGYRNAEGHDALQLFIYRYKITMPQVLDYYHMCNGELDLYTLHKGLAHMEVYAINAAIRGKVDLVYDLPPINMAKYNKVNTGWSDVPELEKGVIATQAQIDAAKFRKEAQLKEAAARKESQKRRDEKQRQRERQRQLQQQREKKLQKEREERERQRIRLQQEQQKEQIRLQMERERKRQQELKKIEQRKKQAAAILAAKLAEQRRQQQEKERAERAERRKLEQRRAQEKQQAQQRRWQLRQKELRERQRQRQLQRAQVQKQVKKVPSIVTASADFVQVKSAKCNKNFHEAGISPEEKLKRMICAFS